MRLEDPMLPRASRAVVALFVAAAACSSEASRARGAVPPPDVAGPPPDALRTPSGLSYRVLASGPRAAHPGPNARVLVHYTGWMTDGTIIDGAPMGGDPAMVDLSTALPGWR